MRTYKYTILLAICALCACKTVQPIEQRHDSVRVEYRLDSVYIYQHDSIFRDRWRNGDTVYITTEKWLTRYKDKIVIQHDTISTNTESVVTQRYVPKFYKVCTISLWVLVAILLIMIALKIYSHLRL